MGISNIERMVDALIRDEMNMVRSMSLEEMDDYVATLISTLLDKTKTDEELVLLDNELLIGESL